MRSFGAALALLWLMTMGMAAGAEQNRVRRPPPSIGPEAARLIVGFRAQGNVRTTLVDRRRTGPIALSQPQTSGADVARLAARVGLPIAASRQLTPSMHVLMLTEPVYGSAVAAVLQALRSDAAVAFADVDQRRYAQTVEPNDPMFPPTSGASGQWYFLTPSTATSTSDAAATDAVSAWSLTTGSTGTVIADVDSGIRFDHPDLQRAGFGGRLLPGYDFVGEDYSRTDGTPLGTFLVANDGDGWDPDPADPGDWISVADQANALFPAAECPEENSSWHGTRVVGILGAITNNATGIAGMTWNSFVLPVRALGKCGGYDSDIIAGMQWAAGLPVAGVPDNPYPADIINLSLGGSGSCPSAYASAIDQLTAMGVLIVASAGNASGAVTAPANCPGVLAVAGLRNIGTKVGYSSFGAQVGIAAPAGNCVESFGPCLRSMDTTTNGGTTTPGLDTYTNQTAENLGTSFSAPVVSGIAALMWSVNANLTPAQLTARMEASARPFPQPAGLPVCPSLATDGSDECACPNDGSQCGAGMVNAATAVNAALRPIAAVQLPAATAGVPAVLRATGSAAACERTLIGYAWHASGDVTIESGAADAQATVVYSGPGSLTLTVTDSAGATDTATVAFGASGATTGAPSSAGRGACPKPLNVTPLPPTITQTFTPGSIAPQGSALLTITLNNANAFVLTQSSLAVTIPVGLTLNPAPAATTTCTGAGLSLTAASNGISLAGANIPSAGSCSVVVSVSGAAPGSYVSTVAARALVTAPGGASTSASNATLTVAEPRSSGGGGGALGAYELWVLTGLLARRRSTRRTARHSPRS